MIVKGITIHNIGNDMTARENYELMVAAKQTNLCHYLIDESEVINVMPENAEASHTGKGYDFGNRFTIAVEICRSQSDEVLYMKAQKKAIAFIKKLMKKYKLSTDDLYFHMDFNQQAYCPHRILEIYGNKGEFINGCFI